MKQKVSEREPAMRREGERALPAGETAKCKCQGEKRLDLTGNVEMCLTGGRKRSVRLPKSIITDQSAPLQFFVKIIFQVQ